MLGSKLGRHRDNGMNGRGLRLGGVKVRLGLLEDLGTGDK